MKVLGIDPSLTCCGLAVVDWVANPAWNDRKPGSLQIRAAQSIKTKSDEDPGLRLATLYEGVKLFILQNRPDQIAIEGYAMGAKFQRETMGEVGGVIRLAIHHSGYFWSEYPVKAWRKIAIGEGDTKDQVRLRAYQIYGWEIKDHNQLEAALVGVAHYLKVTETARPRARRLHGSDTERR